MSANGRGCRSAYSCRSSDPTALHKPQDERGVAWIAAGTSAIVSPSNFIPVNGWPGAKALFPARMMRIERMKTRAIVADIIAEANTSVGETRGVQVTHVRGINVLSADGSARYIDVRYLGLAPD